MASLNPDYQTRASIFIGLKTQSPATRELAWTEFHRRYAPIIRGFARKLGAPSAHLDDIVQDILIGFYSAAPNYIYDPAKGRFRGYLKKCVVSAIGKLHRRLPHAQDIDHLDPASPDQIYQTKARMKVLLEDLLTRLEDEYG